MVEHWVKNSSEFQAITRYYGTRVSKRRSIPLIEHIIQGIWILNTLGASSVSILAFCIHPLFQQDKIAEKEGRAYLANMPLTERHFLIVQKTLKYKTQANSWLSNKVRTKGKEVVLEGSPFKGYDTDVTDMLIADKAQNLFSLMKYYPETFSRRKELEVYFKTWLTHLGISEEEYIRLTEDL